MRYEQTDEVAKDERERETKERDASSNEDDDFEPTKRRQESVAKS